jgi:hypothetical protein
MFLFDSRLERFLVPNLRKEVVAILGPFFSCELSIQVRPAVSRGHPGWTAMTSVKLIAELYNRWW